MKCGFTNSLSSVYFGNAPETNPMKNGQLNMGVVAPPDKLPNASLYNTIYSNETPKQKQQDIPRGTTKLTAGKISAGCAISAIILSAFSLLPFIRKH